MSVEARLNVHQEFRLLTESFKYPVHERADFIKFFESLIRGCLHITVARFNAALAEARRRVEWPRSVIF